MTERDFAEAVRAAVPHIKAGSLSVFGDIFGGRIDNIHTAVGATCNPDGSVTVDFDGGETLQVWDPEGVSVDAATFRVRRASRVRWEWFYYGREQVEDNRYFVEHLVRDDRVEATTNATWSSSRFAPSLASPAVELLGGYIA